MMTTTTLCAPRKADVMMFTRKWGIATTRRRRRSSTGRTTAGLVVAINMIQSHGIRRTRNIIATIVTTIGTMPTMHNSRTRIRANTRNLPVVLFPSHHQRHLLRHDVASNDRSLTNINLGRRDHPRTVTGGGLTTIKREKAITAAAKRNNSNSNQKEPNSNVQNRRKDHGYEKSRKREGWSWLFCY